MAIPTFKYCIGILMTFILVTAACYLMYNKLFSDAEEVHIKT